MKPNPIGMILMGIMGICAGLLAQGIRIGEDHGFLLLLVGGISCICVFIVCLFFVLECGLKSDGEKITHYAMGGIGGSFLGVGLAITLVFTFIGPVAAATLIFLFLLMITHVIMLQFDARPDFFWDILYLVAVLAVYGAVASIVTGNYGSCISMPLGGIDGAYLAALVVGTLKYLARHAQHNARRNKSSDNSRVVDSHSTRDEYDTSNPNSIAAQMIAHNNEYNKILNKKTTEIQQLQHELKEWRKTADSNNTVLEGKYQVAVAALTLIAESSTSENSVVALQQHAEATLSKLRA